MKLLILESPGKVKKVQAILGNDWLVVASVGHVRDLPAQGLGVSLPDFTPQYVPTERGKEVLARLKKLAARAEAVYLATDPDREGEAIAWHITYALNLRSPRRVTYTEITASAVQAAVAAPRELDMALVSAQEARRVLDRLCGYLVSPSLSDAAGVRLSAGRVQSPAVRLVVERERAIRHFVSVTHYGAELTFAGGWTAQWDSKDWREDGQEYFLDREVAERVAAITEVVVRNSEMSQSRQAPPAPFTTSSLQQAASNAFKFTPKRTMELAQKLYEGGHITYMRTDSPNLSQEAVEAIRAYCEGKGYPLAPSPRTWKSKASAQEAHEAIRPTHCEVEEAGQNADEQSLYWLIRTRALASQLADAVYDVCKAALVAHVDGKEAVFEARGRTMREQGWKCLMAADDATSDEGVDNPEADNTVPPLERGARLSPEKGRVLTKQTKPPCRFTEASLVRELENRGIGRPATFAAIVDTIMRREYVRTEKRNLVPTPLGEQVMDLLVGNFSFVDFDFTRTMEDKLDAIATGGASSKVALAEAYTRLSSELSAFTTAHPQKPRNTPEPTDFACPVCGKPLVRLHGAKRDGSGEYDFFACSDRDCGVTCKNINGKPGEARKQPKRSEFRCKCGAALLLREGKTGKFFGCSAYPGCSLTYPCTDDGTPDFNKVKTKGGKKHA